MSPIRLSGITYLKNNQNTQEKLLNRYYYIFVLLNTLISNVPSNRIIRKNFQLLQQNFSFHTFRVVHDSFFISQKM